MASDAPLCWRRAGGRLAAGLALVTAGAVLIVAWHMGWWATLSGAALCAAWIVAADCWSALQARVPAATNPAAPPKPARCR